MNISSQIRKRLNHGQPKPTTETLIVLVGLYTSILSYYDRSPLGSTAGLLVLVITGIFWGFAIRYANPLTLKDLGLARSRVGLYSSIGMIAGVLGWVIQQITSKLNAGQWLSTHYHVFMPLLLSIVAVVIAEEIFFRGYILSRMRYFTVEGWLQILLTCVIWSLYKVIVHLWKGYPAGYYVWLFLTEIYLTLPFTLWTFYTKSIVAPLVSHMVWDYLMYGNRHTVPDWVF